MARNLDEASSCQYPSTSEHKPRLPPTIMDLPNDVVEEIARRAGESLCDFALVHPRFATIFNQMRRPRIEATHICENLQRSMAHISGSVRALILMNCHSESSLILSIILKCPHLTELNAVNSGLTTFDLVQNINLLPKLETLSFSAIELPDASREFSCPEHGSLRNLYVEHGPEDFIFVLNFINSCLKIERLHLIEVPCPHINAMQWVPRLIANFGRGGLDQPVLPPISRERWYTLQTVTLTVVQGGHMPRHFWCVFSNRPASLDVTFGDLCDEVDIVYDRGIFNVMTPTEQIAEDESRFFNERYVVRHKDPVWHFGQPRRLRIDHPLSSKLSGSLPQSIASLTTLVDLDISNCHDDGHPELWFPLFQSSAGLESLTVSLCFLTRECSNAAGTVGYHFVEALQKLKLKKLHCACVECGTFVNCLHNPVLPHLTGLTHLEKLTLMNPPVTNDFFDRIAIRSMSCLKIYKPETGYRNLPKLKMFIATCKKLRYLKVDVKFLPLHEKPLWLRLKRANLKQLCIRTSSREPVDLSLVRKFLPRICKGMDVLHLHALKLKNAKQLSSLLKAEIDKINITREHNPIRLMLPTSIDGYVFVGHEIVSNLPGRALCFFEDVSRHELMGWKND